MAFAEWGKLYLAVSLLFGHCFLPPNIPALHPGALALGDCRVVPHQAHLHLAPSQLLSHANSPAHKGMGFASHNNSPAQKGMVLALSCRQPCTEVQGGPSGLNCK